MISLTNILEDIKSDFDKEQYKNSSALTRKFILSKENVISTSLYKNTGLCEIGIDIPEETTVEELNSLPKWKGMEGKDNVVSEKTGTKKTRKNQRKKAKKIQKRKNQRKKFQIPKSPRRNSGSKNRRQKSHRRPTFFGKGPIPYLSRHR